MFYTGYDFFLHVRAGETCLPFPLSVRRLRPLSTDPADRERIPPMSDELPPIPLSRRWKVGGPRRACAREGCEFVFVGSSATRYCSAECQEIERRAREAERKRRRRREAGAALRSVG